jgi:hypothetical protein
MAALSIEKHLMALVFVANLQSFLLKTIIIDRNFGFLLTY